MAPPPSLTLWSSIRENQLKWRIYTRRGFLPAGRSGLLSAAGTLRSRPQRGFPLQGENQSPAASWDSWQEAWAKSSSSHFPEGKGSLSQHLPATSRIPITRLPGGRHHCPELAHTPDPTPENVSTGPWALFSCPPGVTVGAVHQHPYSAGMNG